MKVKKTGYLYINTVYSLVTTPNSGYTFKYNEYLNSYIENQIPTRQIIILIVQYLAYALPSISLQI